MSSPNSSVLGRTPLAPALSSSTIPRTSSNRSLPSINVPVVHSRPHTPQYSQPDSIGAGYGPQPGDPVFTTPSPSFKVTSSIRSGQSSPRNISSPVQVLHGSASNSSLRSHSVRPSASIPSMRSGGESTHSHSGNRQWSRTHCPSPSVPPGSSPWTTTSSPGAASTSSSQPPSVMVKTKPGSPSPVYEPIRSTSDTWAPSGLRTSTSMGGIAQVPAPRLQRKKSSASLLVSGIGRGLGRVGSVMRRSSNNNNSSDASSQGSGSNGSGSGVGAQTAYNSQTWGAGRRPRRHASTQLQDLCEDENEARSGVSAAPLVKSKSVPIPNGPVDATGRKSRDMMPPGWTRVTAPSTVTPPHSAKNETSSGVSRPFNVQHELHVAADLEGLPTHWINQLKAQGLSEADLLLITAAQRRQRAVTNIPLKPQSESQPTQAKTHVPRAASQPLLPTMTSQAAPIHAATMQPNPPPVQHKPEPLVPPPLMPVSKVEPPTPERSGFVKIQSTKHHKLQAMQRRLSRFNSSVPDLPQPPSPPPLGATVIIPAVPPPQAVPPKAAVPPTAPKPSHPPVSAGISAVAARPTMTRTVSSETAATIATVGSAASGATGIYRKPSIISKLLDDLDSVSAHPSRPQQGSMSPGLCPPPHAEAGESDAESLRSSRPPSMILRDIPAAPKQSMSRSRKSSVASIGGSLHRTESKRLSDELRGFRDLAINDEDGWASSVLAAWDGENSISMTRTRTASPAPAAVLVSQRIPEPVGSVVQQPPEAAGFGLAVTPPSKPQSLRSIRRTSSPSPTPSLSPGRRRRSRSFDFDPALRATLYSPPPPPPHSRKHNPAFHSVHGSFSLSAAPILERRRKSIDSFGNHPDDDDDESCTSRSPSGSELDLGTPPLEAEDPSTAQAKPPAVASKETNIAAPLDILPPRHSSLPRDVPQSESHASQEDDEPSRRSASIESVDLSAYTNPDGNVVNVHRSEHFSFPASAVSHSQTSDSSPVATRPQSPEDEEDDSGFSFGSNAHHGPAVSTLGLCLSLGEPSNSSHGHSPTSPQYSHTRGPSQGQSSYPSYMHSRSDSNTHSHVLSASFSPMNVNMNISNMNGALQRSNTKASKMSVMSDDMRLSDNRHSTLSRMSSVASSITSYNIHEATVHRAYTRVLRRVNETSREGTETPPPEDVAPSVSECDTERAMGALEDAAWSVAVRERVARITTQ